MNKPKHDLYLVKVFIGLSLVVIFLFIGFKYFTPNNILESREVVMKIIRITIPEFDILESKVKHQSNFDSEISTTTKIQFNHNPDNTIFNQIDSIIILTGKSKVMDTELGYWKKKGDDYEYILINQGMEHTYIESDGFFYFKMKKNSIFGEIEYGNY